MLTTTTEFDSRIDKEVLADEIIRECGAMLPVHNTTDSYVYFHDHFFKKWAGQISALLDTLDYKYNPLETYQRYEDKTGNEDNVRVTDINQNVTSQDEITEDNGVVNKVSGFNSEEFVNDNSTDEDNHSNYDATRVTSEDNTRTDTIRRKEDNIIRGNNGMYTSQQLVEQQRNLQEFNVYMWIVRKYSNELFYGVF